MPRVASFPTISSLDLYSEETNASTNVGALYLTDDGKMFRYALAGGTTLVNGHLLQAPAEDTAFSHMAVQAAAAIGATTIAVTLGGTSTTANLFNGGVLVIDAGASQLGQVFTIVSHDVATNGTTCNFQVLEKVQVALTTSGFATVKQNPYMSVIDQPTTHTGVAVGGAVHAITTLKYGYIQTHGVGAALSDATVTAATTMGLSPSVTTAGTVTKHVNQDQYVGRSLVAVNVSARVYPMFWQLD